LLIIYSLKIVVPEKYWRRFHYLMDYLFGCVMIGGCRMTTLDRDVYAVICVEPENIRAFNA
jgi:hypothetical protein